MKKVMCLVSFLLLTACQQQSEPSVSTVATTENSSIAQTEESITLYGNDELGYFISEIELVNFADVNNNPDVANTQQWMDLETMSILSLTSFPKSDFTKILTESPEEWKGFAEVDVVLGNVLDVYLGVEDAVVKADQDTFNDIFYDSNLGWIDLGADDESVRYLTVAFLPTENSDRIYLISSEGTQADAVRDLLTNALYTWSPDN